GRSRELRVWNTALEVWRNSTLPATSATTPTTTNSWFACAPKRSRGLQTSFPKPRSLANLKEKFWWLAGAEPTAPSLQQWKRCKAVVSRSRAFTSATSIHFPRIWETFFHDLRRFWYQS